MDLFWADISSNQEISWEDLIQDINIKKTFNSYCKHYDYYEIFKQIILSLIIGEEIIMLDSDFSEEEIRNLVGFNDLYQFEKPLKDDSHFILSKEDLLSKISNVNDEWQITLFTSGTTGLPKKVTHSFQNITRFVNTKITNNSAIWGFAYNPTHMAGIQVFFQAVLNGNPMIRLFGLSKNNILQAFEKYQITHVSATPTFYRLLLPSKKVFENVERITSGGEKLDVKTTEQLRGLFPKAKIKNIYATTEAGTLFASDDDVFSIKPEVSNLVKILNYELLIHKSFLGITDLNKKEWYETGDLVEVINENPLQFRFLTRKNEMINVGGNKVNPTEVEEAIRGIEGIKDARVFGKANSVLGNIVCCEIVRVNKDLDEPKIRSVLKSKLQEFKIPRIILFVEEIKTTRTGKIKRN